MALASCTRATVASTLSPRAIEEAATAAASGFWVCASITSIHLAMFAEAAACLSTPAVGTPVAMSANRIGSTPVEAQSF
jgi:hypothetical protein